MAIALRCEVLVRTWLVSIGSFDSPSVGKAEADCVSTADLALFAAALAFLSPSPVGDNDGELTRACAGPDCPGSGGSSIKAAQAEECAGYDLFGRAETARCKMKLQASVGDGNARAQKTEKEPSMNYSMQTTGTKSTTPTVLMTPNLPKPHAKTNDS
jgi:hypothetical protein